MAVLVERSVAALIVERIRLPLLEIVAEPYAVARLIGTEQVRQAVWHMVGEHEPTMPHYRSTLSAAQARAIVEHLKRSE